MNLTPEQQARQDIDAALEAAGWILQNRDAINLAAGPGVAVREARMASGHGFADYLPFVYISTGVETRFINGLDPDPKTRTISANLPHIHRPETLAEWIGAETLDAWVKRLHAEGGASPPCRPWNPAPSIRTRSRPWPTWSVRSRRTARGR